MILNPAEVGEITKAQLGIAAVYGTLGAVASDAVSEQKCVGALIAGAEPTYRGSNYGGVVGLGLKGTNNRSVDEGAVAFGDAAAAHEFVKTRVAQWKDCVGKVLTLAFDGKPATYWVARAPATSYGVPVLLRSQEGTGGYGCSHGLAAANNVVVDVLACSHDAEDLNDQVGAIANKMLSKIAR